MFEIYSGSEKGIRENNEDSVVVSKKSKNYFLCAVADGMGGHKAGDVASRLAVNILEKNYILYTGEDYISFLKNTFEEINNDIYKQSLLNSKYENMGTTLTVVIVHKTKMYIASVGDSRAYFINNKNEMSQLTKDHSLVEVMIENGEISRNEARKSKLKNILLQAVGTNKQVVVDISEYKVPRNFEMIICSDGLIDGLFDEQILDITIRNKGEDKVDTLILEAIKGGSKDNISVISIKREVEL